MSYNAVKLAHKNEGKECEKKMKDSLQKVIDEFKVKFINK